ncbi:MAG: RloB family protein [Bdellovibrionaceae bacterium]|uniref:RloB family protein n=1 Tax=Acinetobacter sp. ANC 4216 TaxID=2529840 RepID=UPI00103EACF8|nr:RloB family protein [Acinetobacter sp. ANC 4216]MCK6597543.1 RloB family protein [Pseudobdellovibrionaceae bacterium]TCB63474.1 RloB domain-containing protein [Acinetobacter sp. ANC 4216]
MSRSFEAVVRTEKYKEPNKFFYIACEGHVTEVEYFQKLNEVGEKCKFVHYERAENEKNNSSPKNVFKTLKKNVKEAGLNPKTDECWIIVDRDQWNKNLAEAVQECLNHNYKYSVSSPCIEIWFIMHLVKIDSLIQPFQAPLLQNPIFYIRKDRRKTKVQFCESYLDFLLKTYLGKDMAYEKNSALPDEFFNKEKINFAIEQAKEIEGKIKDPEYRYPMNHIGSQLYQLLENFLKFNEEHKE